MDAMDCSESVINHMVPANVVRYSGPVVFVFVKRDIAVNNNNAVSC
jgi:hypothetical protein